jgi:hypothetical protein
MSLLWINRVVVILFIAGFLTAGNLQAQDQPPMDPKMQEMMKKWEEAGTPGAPHKILNDLVGSWNVSSKWWMEGPEGPPMESKGTAEVKWVLGGRFIEERFSGEMMGKPFEGFGYSGYDNFNKQYQFIWMDNSSTAIFPGEGSYDAKTKALIYPVKMDDPGTGEKDKPGLFVYQIINPDKHILEMYDGDKINPKMRTAEMIYIKK